MRTRLLTTLLLWTLVGAALEFGGAAGGEALLWAVAMGCAWELFALLKRLQLEANPLAGAAALGLALAGHFWGFASVGTSAGLIVAVTAHWKTQPKAMVAALGSLVLLGAGFGSLVAIARLGGDAALAKAVWVIAVVKLSDAGAYLIGSKVGRHPLWPQVSPGKTREGLFGALLSGFLLGLMGAPLFYPLWVGPLLGMLLALAGSVGDLLESLLKRTAGVKDSGALLPGIGGILDLCDSLIFAAPVAYLALRYFVQ